MVDLVTRAEPLGPAELDQLELRLRTSLGSQIHDLRVTQRNGVFVLRGCSRTYFAKLLAEQKLDAVVGHRLIFNEIVVK